jgi:putative Holliday junction resolvase
LATNPRGSAPFTALAFDFGLVKIGVAAGQSLLGTAQALAPLKARDGAPQWEQVQALLAQWQPQVLVVGLPLNMDGSDNDITVRARRFANRLSGRFGVAHVLWDERLSTREAKEIALGHGHRGNFHEAPVDSFAAQLILESWFNAGHPGHA